MPTACEVCGPSMLEHAPGAGADVEQLTERDGPKLLAQHGGQPGISRIRRSRAAPSCAGGQRGPIADHHRHAHAITLQRRVVRIDSSAAVRAPTRNAGPSAGVR